MTREQWKAMHHTLRAEAREFRARHGGWPCLVRRFQHNGITWTLDRFYDYRHSAGATTLWCLLADQPRALRAHRMKDLRCLLAWSREGRTMHKAAARHVIAQLRAA